MVKKIQKETEKAISNLHCEKQLQWFCQVVKGLTSALTSLVAATIPNRNARKHHMSNWTSTKG
jgi:hypothetical protein